MEGGGRERGSKVRESLGKGRGRWSGELGCGDGEEQDAGMDGHGKKGKR